jgi:hypothetical protein
MYPKLFFENFWSSGQKNEIFIGIPFDGEYNTKFQKIDRVAKSLGFDKANTVKEGIIAGDIIHEILDGIANSKTLLFDISDDTRWSKINENVTYELGIAHAMREPEDILVIRKKSEKPISFDFSHIRYHEYDVLGEDWLKEKLNDVIETQKWHKSKRINRIISLLDVTSLQFILCFGLNPLDHTSDHFHDGNIKDPIQKLAILRLLDLNIIYTAMDYTGMAYHFTNLGRAVIENIIDKLKIKRKEGKICNDILEYRELLEHV